MVGLSLSPSAFFTVERKSPVTFHNPFDLRCGDKTPFSQRACHHVQVIHLEPIGRATRVVAARNKHQIAVADGPAVVVADEGQTVISPPRAPQATGPWLRVDTSTTAEQPALDSTDSFEATALVDEIEPTAEAETIGDDDDTSASYSLDDTFSSETAINLDQSDPLAEADFHMAYGLYDQAADLVKGALAVDPSDNRLKAKLAEMRSEREEQAARQLKQFFIVHLVDFVQEHNK